MLKRFTMWGVFYLGEVLNMAKAISGLIIVW
jgi:hypothetical protein